MVNQSATRAHYAAIRRGIKYSRPDEYRIAACLYLNDLFFLLVFAYPMIFSTIRDVGNGIRRAGNFTRNYVNQSFGTFPRVLDSFSRHA